jgi:hypothetical protein
MSPQPDAADSCDEARIILAIQAIQNDATLSCRVASSIYNVPRATLQKRLAGRSARRDCEANSKKLTKLEEEVIVGHIKELDSHGFSPTLADVRDMADTLLGERGVDPVGKNWPSNFVNRTPSIKTHLSHPYDYRRAKCEDPEIMKKWFQLVEDTKEKYGITTEDIYNFDETGFQMGVISSQIVVTGTERRNRPKAVQPGDREWVTVIQGINAAGWAIPPYLILKAKHHQSTWYSEDIPNNWVIGVSDNGWTTNVHGVEWLKHFNSYTKNRCVGRWRLLIFDGHESHHSVEFLDLCKQNRILALCMPAHASHILQPLDVGCFSPLKRAYGTQISHKIRYGVNHIDKLSFLPAFRAAYEQAITKDNICGSFRGTGLVPFDPNVVISQLDVKLPSRKATPEQQQEEVVWKAKTPGNPREFDAQTKLLCNRIKHHLYESPTAIIEMVEQINRGATKVAHIAVLNQRRTEALQAAVTEATKRKQRKRKRIQAGGILTVEQGLQIASSKAGEGKKRRVEPLADGDASRVRRCSQCKKPGHNSRTCKNHRESTQ